MSKRTNLLTALGAVALAAAAGSAYAGNVCVTGGDQDWHAHNGGNNAVGAQRFINKIVAWGTGGYTATNTLVTPHPRILLVTSREDVPHAGGTSDSVLGIEDAMNAANGGPPAGFDLTVADAKSHAVGATTSGGRPLISIDSAAASGFAGYDVLCISSNFGGTLTQAELSKLNANKAAIITWVNGGDNRLLFALAEGNDPHDVGTNPSNPSYLDPADIYGFLANIPTKLIDESQLVQTSILGPANETRKIGLVAMDPITHLPNPDDINGNFAHTSFIKSGLYDVLDYIPADPDDVDSEDIIFTLVTSQKLNDGGGVDPGGGGGCTFSGCGITLGAAADLTVFQFNDKTDKEHLDIHGAISSIEGNVGVSGGCEIHGNQGTITGDLELANDDGGATSKLKKFTIVGGAPPGTPTSAALHQAELDAEAASDLAAAKAVTQNLGDVKQDKHKGDLTINSTGECNVIAIKKLELHECTFTLNGNPGDVFIINVSEKAHLHKVTMQLTGGLTGDTVLFNFPGKHGDADIHESIAYGTWLSQDGHMHLHKSTLYGAMQSGEDIHIHESQIICH